MGFEVKYPTGHIQLTNALGEAFGANSSMSEASPSYVAVAEIIINQTEQFARTIYDLDRLIATYNSQWLGRSSYATDYMVNYPSALVQSGRQPVDTITTKDNDDSRPDYVPEQGDLLLPEHLPFIVELLPTKIEESPSSVRAPSEKNVEVKRTLAEAHRDAFLQSLGSLSLSATQVQLILNQSSGLDSEAVTITESRQQTEDATVVTVYHLYFHLLQNRHPDIDIDLVRNSLIEIMPIILNRRSALFDATVSRSRLNMLEQGQFSDEFVKYVDNLGQTDQR